MYKRKSDYFINILVPLPSKKGSQESQFSVSQFKRQVKQKYIDMDISSMRKTIAKRLTESKVRNS